VAPGQHDTGHRDAQVLVTDSGPSTGEWTAPCPAQTPPPNPTAAEPDGRRVLSRVGVADHEVTPKAPWTGSGWREYSYGGFGGGHPYFLRACQLPTPNLAEEVVSGPHWPRARTASPWVAAENSDTDGASPGLVGVYALVSERPTQTSRPSNRMMETV
jgi:hypothetical protein